MNISVLLSIIAEMYPDRVAVTDRNHRLSYLQLDKSSDAVAARIVASGHDKVALLDTNTMAFPVLFFAAAKAGVPFVCLNYRLADDRLRAQVQRLAKVLLVTDPVGGERLSSLGQLELWDRDTMLQALAGEREYSTEGLPRESDAAACWLFTSGTTGEPKTAVLTHENLTSYILGTVEPGSAEETEAVLVSVPPYHIAGLASVLSSVFSGRRIVYLENFEPDEWVERADAEQITQAMVVPTMLQRILQTLEEKNTRLPNLRNLSYGGGRMPQQVVEQSLQMLPHVGFTNAYGLTETSSTITLFGPEEHRRAIESTDPQVRQRLGSVGKPVPGLELEIRDESQSSVAPGTRGEIWVRGPQVSGQYLGQSNGLIDGWFRTKDQGWLDEEGYLYLLGRMDDVIVRGGENLSPGEIEDVLRQHPAVADVAVVGQDDTEWGEVPVAVIVSQQGQEPDPAELSALVRGNLRSSRVPAQYLWVSELPYNETGKLLRNKVRESLNERAL